MYQEKQTQKQRLLRALQQGKKVCQIDLNLYLYLRKSFTAEEFMKNHQSNVVDAIADLGIANLPARIFGLKKDGYEIKSEKINVKGRYCKTFYMIYYL